MDADEYNRLEMLHGRLRPDQVTKMTKLWQEHNGIVVDGFCGPKTRASMAPATARYWPLPRRPGIGSPPQITSGFKTRNPSRPTHNGVDIFYRSEPGDSALPKSRNTGRWCIPLGTMAVAPCSGVVTDARPKHSTGGLVWLRVGDEDVRVGFMHLASVLVTKGQLLNPGDPIGEVGANPLDLGGLVHLHFEVSPLYAYSPQDPEEWLTKAGIL